MKRKCFQIDEAVVACSGPSLREVDVFSLGLPVIAISTAIRYIANPHIWIYADRLNDMHGDEGKKANTDPSIMKIVPAYKADANPNTNTIVCNYKTSNKSNNLINDLFTNNNDFIRGPHKSITLAIQVLHYMGFRKLIFAGNDLNAKSQEDRYAYKLDLKDKKKGSNYVKSLNQAEGAFRDWYPYALKQGLEWYSWKCGPMFEKIVPAFDDSAYEKVGRSVYFFDFKCIQDSMGVAKKNHPIEPVNIRRKKRLISYNQENENNIPQENKVIQRKPVIYLNKHELLKIRLKEEKQKRNELRSKAQSTPLMSKHDMQEIKRNIITDRRKSRQEKLDRARKKLP